MKIRKKDERIKTRDNDIRKKSDSINERFPWEKEELILKKKKTSGHDDIITDESDDNESLSFTEDTKDTSYISFSGSEGINEQDHITPDRVLPNGFFSDKKDNGISTTIPSTKTENAHEAHAHGRFSFSSDEKEISATQEEEEFTAAEYIKRIKRESLSVLINSTKNANDETDMGNELSDEIKKGVSIVHRTDELVLYLERIISEKTEKKGRRKRVKRKEDDEEERYRRDSLERTTRGKNRNDGSISESYGSHSDSPGDSSAVKSENVSIQNQNSYNSPIDSVYEKEKSRKEKSLSEETGSFAKKAVFENRSFFISVISFILIIAIIGGMVFFSFGCTGGSPLGMFTQSDESYASLDEYLSSLIDELEDDLRDHENGRCSHIGEENVYDGNTGGCGFRSDETRYEINGSIPWREIFTVYVIISNEARESASGENEISYAYDFDDENARALLREIFHHMVFFMCRRTVERNDDEEKIIRTVVLNLRTAEEFGERNGFTEDQMEIIREMTDEESDPLWDEFFSHLPSTNRAIYYTSSVMGGGGTGIADAALRAYQERYTGSYICSDLHVGLADWCAYFASWCCKEAEVDLESAIGFSVSGYVPSWYEGARSHGIWHGADTSYIPSPGDMVIWRSSVYENAHITVVVEVNGSTFYDVGGNEGGGSPSTSRIQYEGPFDVHSGTSGSQWIKGYVETSKYDTANGGNMIDNGWRIMSFFESEGYSVNQIKGILGNWACEGTNLDPTSVESIFDEPFRIGPKKRAAIEADFLYYPPFNNQYGGMKAGIGLAGFTGANNDDLMDFAQSRRRQWYDLALQVAFSYSSDGYTSSSYLRNTYRNTNFSSSYDAAYEFMDKYEKPGYRNPATRNTRGSEIYESVKGKYGNTRDNSFVSKVNSLL